MSVDVKFAGNIVIRKDSDQYLMTFDGTELVALDIVNCAIIPREMFLDLISEEEKTKYEDMLRFLEERDGGSGLLTGMVKDSIFMKVEG